MSATDLSIAVILGSARYGRRCEAIARWATEAFETKSNMAVDVVDPQQMPLSLVDQPLSNGAWHELEMRLEKTDAFVIVTPEYHHGYTAVLKHIIDAVPDVWRAKPVGFVSYGAHSGGLRAVEQLKPVFASLQAIPLTRAVALQHVERYFANGDEFEAGSDDVRHLLALAGELQDWASGLKSMREPGRTEMDRAS